MSTKVNIDLLKRLQRRFLRMRHPKHFRMKQIAIKTDCGAAMCMVGHILTLEGYRMKLRKNGSEFMGASRSDYDFIHPITGEAVYDPADEARRILGGDSIFGEFNLKTPKQAARRIQQIIDNPKLLS